MPQDGLDRRLVDYARDLALQTNYPAKLWRRTIIRKDSRNVKNIAAGFGGQNDQGEGVLSSDSLDQIEAYPGFEDIGCFEYQEKFMKYGGK
jgi:hypothetical protein